MLAKDYREYFLPETIEELRDAHKRILAKASVVLCAISVKRGDYQFSKLPSFWSTNSHRSVGFVDHFPADVMSKPTRGYDTSGDGVISIKAPDVLV